MQKATNDDAIEPDDGSSYRDDPSLFAQSSDLVRKGETGQYAGNGPDSGSDGAAGVRGSQEDWQGGPARASASGGDQDVSASRSDDPGQSSDGGFKGEGAADGKNHAADAGGDGGDGGDDSGAARVFDENEDEGAGTSEGAPDDSPAPDRRPQ